MRWLLESGFKNLISGGRKHSWECSALPSSGGRGHSCECKRPLGCYTRPPNSTLSLPFPGMTNTLYTIGPLIKVSREGKNSPQNRPQFGLKRLNRQNIFGFERPRGRRDTLYCSPFFDSISHPIGQDPMILCINAQAASSGDLAQGFR